MLYMFSAAPGPPKLSVTAQLNGLEVYCSPGDQAVYCNVTIEIKEAVRSIASNGTFSGLASNTLYPVSARAINRCRDFAEINASHWTCKFVVTSSWYYVLYISTRGSTYFFHPSCSIIIQSVCNPVEYLLKPHCESMPCQVVN